MSIQTGKLLLVGDNPFHGISHLSQEQARSRNAGVPYPIEEAAKLVLASIKHGANGFMFSVSETTLSILNNIRDQESANRIELYPIVPYAFEYVRIATQTGTPGLAKRFAKQIVVSGDIITIFQGLKAVTTMNPKGLINTYLAYELSRIKSSVGKHANVVSILLHEVITDMSLALDFDWLFHSYIKYLLKSGITPGFHTRNFPYLVSKFREWNIDLEDIVITTPFNKAGFQMNPSREECEKTLASLSGPTVLAISVLAGGYLQAPVALDYISRLENLKGVVAGISTQQQASETFQLFKERLRY